MNDSTVAFPASSAVAPPTTLPRLADHAPGAGLVSWGAIFAGAAGAAALSLILLILGTGLGLSSVSPWSGRGAGAAAIGVSTILWITLTQLAASGMGGYLAGRLRARWAGTDPDEVYFRDTAHGFLAWAVATLVTAAMLSAVVGAIVGSGTQAAASVVGGAATTATAAAGATAAGAAGSSGAGANGTGSDSTGYFVDMLMRRDMPAAGGAASAPGMSGDRTGSTGNNGSNGENAAATASNTAAETTRIFASAMAGGTLPADDARYLGQQVSARTDLSQADAEKRVTDTFARMQAKAQAAENAAREAADKARKASAYSALWIFVSLLAGAFVASLMATFGGRRRDLF